MNTQFKLKLPKVIYKVKHGSGLTISNQKMTDELAIEFLKVKPSRIELFSVYPDNYLELIGEDKSAEQVEALPELVEKKSDEIIHEIVKESSKKPCSGCKDKKTISGKKITPQKRTTRGSKSTKK